MPSNRPERKAGQQGLDFLLGDFWTGWRVLAAWTVCIGAALLLGALRIATDAEFAIASLVSLPVLVIAWISGRRGGLTMAAIAALVWSLSEFNPDRPVSAAWIPWANLFARLFTYGIIALLASRVRTYFDLEHANANEDHLTGLFNRRAFLENGKREVRRARRYGRHMAVAFLDLDNFKQLNDSQGHHRGDRALKATADALAGALRASDIIARLGGDEFAILLPEIEYDAAVETARKIFLAAGGALGKFPPVTCSLGMVWYGDSEVSFEAMLRAADRLMYEVKSGGKNNMRTQRVEADTVPEQH